jgi:polyhydroxyalkanoate synthesis regulator phasin
MSDKLEESLQYLKNCSIIESEAFKLYETLSKKINQPESSFILGLAYDSLKNAKIIQGILDNFEPTELENKNARKNLSELGVEIATLQKTIAKINSLDYLISCEILKQTTKLEAAFSKVYTNYLQSNFVKLIVDELLKTGTMNLADFKKVIEGFVEEKGKHRETIVEAVYILEGKETETRRQITPLVKYQNPDAWIRESTVHTFTNPITSNE